MTTLIVIAVIAAVVAHLAAGAHTHRRHRRAALNPRLYWSLGRGLYGTIRLPGGFRVGHKL